MKFKGLLAVILLALSTSIAYASDDAASAITAAKEANSKAAALGFEWKSTGKIIKKAEAAVEKESEKALKLAKKALSQAKAAIKQAEVAKSAGPKF